MSEWIRPGDLAEACEARAQHPDYWLIAGGTDLMVVAPNKPAPPGMIDVFGMDELVGVHKRGNGLFIGAATTYTQLMESSLLQQAYPNFVQAAREVGAMQIQNRGTIGGNVATSSPVGDTLPCLLAANARVHLASTKGPRNVDYVDFVTGYRTTDLQADELIVGLELSPSVSGQKSYWRKVGTRRAQAISKVMAAGQWQLENKSIKDARIALGAVADRTIRLPSVERLLEGQTPTEELAREVERAVEANIAPIDDVRSNAAYRAHVAGKIVARFVRQSMDDCAAAH